MLGRADADMQHVIYQVEYQRQLRTQVQSILEQLQANEFETISEYLTQCYEEGFMGSLYSMQQQGVPLAFPINQEQVVMAIQTDSKISEGLYTRLGKDVSELKKNISSEIARGISTSASYSQIAKNLDRQAQIGLNRAMRITRTEGGRIQNKAAMDTMVKAKEMGADVVKRWSAALDARTRDSHARIDGEVKEIEEKFSNGLMYPKDPSGSASEVVNCRCKVQERARWALTANQTKMLGDVSKMSDEQKEAIASKLGVPVKDLGKYSGQIVPINAKNYADFKKQYKGIWNYEGSDLQKEAEARIAGYKQKSSKNSQKALENSKNSDTIKLPDFQVGKSVGAKAKNYDIRLPNREVVHLTEGSRVTNVRVIAGKGRNREIDELPILILRYPGTKEEEWQKVKGLGYVDYDGESYKAELHWYEEPSVGRVEWKVKPDADGNWFIDED